MDKKPISKGKQKIDIKEIDDKANRDVTFSKRRNGIYKKVTEINTMCGAESGVVVFSPAGRAFSFGHPDIETVVNRVFPSPSAPNQGERDLILDVVHANRAERIVGLNQQQTELLEILKNGKHERDTRKELAENSKQQALGGSIDEFGLEELKTLKSSLEALKSNVFNKLEVLNVNDPHESGPCMDMGPFRGQ
ncbi:Agamous-like mads-box protein agl62 [Thalictrum thalictroides]|uniref:Agamous-like mads-box protein agl62 n=1 Tax=Thalictrum thalictroides TaxID=46969 RepID=A0A7J6VFU2_THATH|nr:Agamous-like mads-box protein agl62 [Thalictrum thalictroides]